MHKCNKKMVPSSYYSLKIKLRMVASGLTPNDPHHLVVTICALVSFTPTFTRLGWCEQ